MPSNCFTAALRAPPLIFFSFQKRTTSTLARTQLQKLLGLFSAKPRTQEAQYKCSSSNFDSSHSEKSSKKNQIQKNLDIRRVAINKAYNARCA
uniref:Uncharacterized protein n=1 Tax=Aegilops tauschii subsp. strangulata TaxID=200361 RepID=A0A453AP73_AEGTS